VYPVPGDRRDSRGISDADDVALSTGPARLAMITV